MTANKDVAVRIKQVSKTFKLPHEKHSSLKGLFLNSFRRKSFELQEAVKNVSFEIYEGEFLGIVGRNGSGKSTLLKCIAGVYQPNNGSITINGTLVPFIELGVGFNPELSGRDNVFLNGALLGFSHKQMERMYDDIVEFAELEKFMDQKLKNYSSGMQVRLAFSIAIRAKGDILVLDEVLAVGDTNFQRKCIEVFHDLKTQGKTIVLVSHDTIQIERFCDRVIVLDKGQLVFDGNPSEAISIYDELNRGVSYNPSESGRNFKITESPSLGMPADFLQQAIEVSDQDKEIEIAFPITLNKKLPKDTVVAITFENENSHTIFWYATDQNDKPLKFEKIGKNFMKFSIANVFPEGRYFIDVSITNKDRAFTYLGLENMAVVKCSGLSNKEWLIRAPTKLEIK